jgi:hypothetical protein
MKLFFINFMKGRNYLYISVSPFNLALEIVIYSVVVEGFSLFIFSPHGATAPSGPGLPHYRGFTITLRHTTLGRTPLDE